jgi:PqqD family protein of HPr-rel-A system
MTDVRPKLRDDVTFVEVDQEAVAYDPLSKLVHYLNPMGSIVLQLCDGTSTVDETIAELAEAQEVEPAEIDESIRALIDNFVAVGLVEPGEAATKLIDASKDGEDKRAKVRREVPRSE